MKGLFALLLIGGIALLMFGSSSKSGALPAAQRTAIYAPAQATNIAGGQAASMAQAQAQADEQEAARVYAQAQQDEQVRLSTLATQQAAFATQTSNDIAVSAESATLVATSLQATSEAISQTLTLNREKYKSDVAAIHATQQAVIDKASESNERNSATKQVGLIWLWMGPIVVGLLVLLLFVAGWKLIGRIQPRIEEVEIEVPARPTVATVEPAKPIDENRQAAYQLAMQYVSDSIRENGGKSDKLLTASEWERLGNNREGHTAAIQYLRSITAIRTQQGGPAEDQGTFVREAGKDLVYLLRTLSTSPPP